MRADSSQHSFVGRAALLVVLGFLLVAVTDRSSNRVHAAGDPSQTQSEPPSQPPRRFSPSFTIEGLVNAPRTITLEDLQALPSQEIAVEFISGGSVEQRTYRGVLHHDLLMAAGPQFDRDRRNDMLRWYVTVSATDDYHAVIAWGEIDPGFEAKQVMVAYEEDGELLGDDDGMARLVVPGDQRGGRYVSNIVSIRLDRAPAPE